MNRFFVAAAAAALAGGCAAQNQGQGGAALASSASIPFVQFGNIYDWQATGETGIYIESDTRKWYYATFIAPCLNLPFIERVGFRTTPPLPMDKFDSILAGRESCYFKTFDRVPGPPGAKPSQSPAS